MLQKRVEKALAHARETNFLKIGENILTEIPQIFKEQFPGKKAVIVADSNTFFVAGKEVQRQLSLSGLEDDRPLVIDDPDLYGNYDFVQKVRDFLAPLDAVAIAVGSGVINDLTKLASHELGRPYLCVATAASMDGYSAFGASITKDGAKQTMTCSAPRAIVADLSVISKAPPINNASGYADLYAKVTAGADWIFADALSEELLNDQAWHIVQDGLKDALKDPERISKGDVAAIAPLVEGLMLGGFAMQSLQSSRPASGAEHQFSHLWDMEHHVFSGDMAKTYGLYKDKEVQAPSHGFKVGVGLLTVTALYERILATPLEKLDVDAAVSKWKSLEEQIEEINDAFKEAEVRKFAANQISGKYIGRADLRKQLTFLKENWIDIRARLKEQLIPYEETRQKLSEVGAPVACEQIDISRQRLRESFYKAQKIRTRFTVLDVAVRTGYLDQWVDELFETGGIFNQ